jgi:ribosomal 30S subunit maturation factor RimM
MTQPGGLWVCGTLGQAHGLKGELYLDLAPDGHRYLTMGARFFVYREGAGEPEAVRVERTGGTDQRPLVHVAQAATREQALALQGATLMAGGGHLDAIPYHRVGSLLGLRVVCGLRELGEVADVLTAPAQDVLDIRRPDGEHTLVPLVEELVTVDLESGTVSVREGLL